MKTGFPKVLGYIVLCALPLLAVTLALGVGRYGLSPRAVLEALALGPAAAADNPASKIVYNVRLPRALLALLVGSGLSVAGCCFQAVFSNPLASPDTLGVSSGAAFGAAIGIVISGGIVLTQIFSISCGLLAIGLTFLLSRSHRNSNVLMIVLAGVITSALFNALVSSVKYFADPTTKLPEITYWLMGSMMGASYHDITIALPLVFLPVILIFFIRWRLNVLILSDEEITSLGVKTSVMRWLVILLCTLIIAACVSVCGQVGWVGLVIPHMARRVVGYDHKILIPTCASAGGTYLLLIDTLARSLTAGELPLSILTAVIGVPIFVLLFFRRGEKSLET